VEFHWFKGGALQTGRHLPNSRRRAECLKGHNHIITANNIFDKMAMQPGWKPPPLRHFLQVSDFSLEETMLVLNRAKIIKKRFKNYELYHPLVRDGSN
jgi:hypothetical protein